jgi:hypothetical protein
MTWRHALIKRFSLLAIAAGLCSTLTGCFASPPQIIALDPNRGSIGVPADAPITVQFDRAVVPASIAGRFSVAPSITGCNLNVAFVAGPGAPCHVEWLAGDTQFVLRHTGAVLAPSTHYTFTLSGGFSDIAGSVNTVDHRWDLTTAQAPQVRATSPSDGANDVPIDGPFAVTFTEPMDASATISAITLDPPVPDTQVMRNSKDATRFVVLPGRLLLPDTTYRLVVTRSAVDQHRQGIASPVTATFTTGALGNKAHAVVLSRTLNELATRVQITSLAPAQAGEPIPAATVLTAPRCTAPAGCGRAANGSPLYSFRTAALSPGGTWLAVVEQDETGTAAPASLVVLNPATGVVQATISGATLPSWSPDAAVLAFAQGAAVRLYRPATGVISSLPSGDPILSPPIWTPGGELLVLDALGPTGIERVEFADVVVGARYAVPGLTGSSSHPAVSPDGTQLAVVRSGASMAGTWLVGLGEDASPPRLLDPGLVPVGYAAPGTLVAMLSSATATTGLVQVGVAADTQIPIAHTPPALSAVTVSASGRQLVYLAPDAGGVIQAYVENADGSDPLPLTEFLPGEAVATAVTVSR